MRIAIEWPGCFQNCRIYYRGEAAAGRCEEWTTHPYLEPIVCMAPQGVLARISMGVRLGRTVGVIPNQCPMDVSMEFPAALSGLFLNLFLG